MKHLRQKLFLFALALALLAHFFPAPPARAAETAWPSQIFGTRLMDAQESILSAAVVGRKVYVLTDQNLYALSPGEKEVRTIAPAKPARQDLGYQEGEFNSLLSIDERLYGFNIQLGLLYALDIAPAGLQATLAQKFNVKPLKMGEGQSAWLAPRAIRVLSGKLYIIASSDRTNQNTTYAFDLKTGKGKKLKSPHLWDLAPYQEDRLLAIYHNPKKKVRDDWSNYHDVGVYDLQKDRVSLLEEVPEAITDGMMEPTLFYDAARSRLLANDPNGPAQINRKGERKLLFPLPNDGDYNFKFAKTPAMLPLPGDHLLIVGTTDCFIRPLDPNLAPPVVQLLLTRRLPDEKAVSRALAQMPGVTVQTLNDLASQSGEGLAAQLLTDTLQADLLVLASDQDDVESILKKGYLSDLSDDPALAAYADGLLPALDKVMRNQQGLYTLPVQMHLSLLTINRLNAEATGIRPPATFPELFSLIDRWGSELAGHQDDFLIASFAPIQKTLKRAAFQATIDRTLQQGPQMHFDLAELEALMNAIDALDVAGFDFPNIDVLDEQANAKRPLLNTGSYVLQSQSNPIFEEPLLLPAREGEPFRAQGQALLVGVYARSQQAETARRFLRLYLKAQHPLTHAMVCPAQTEAIPNPNYEEEIASQQNLVDNTREALKTAKGAQERMLKEDLAYFQKNLDEKTRLARYYADEEALKKNHRIMSGVYVQDSLALAQTRAIHDSRLFDAYLDGTLRLESFVSQANDILRLVRLETQ